VSPLARRLALTGCLVLACTIVLAVTRPPLGSNLFFALALVMTLCYVAMLAGVWHAGETSRRLVPMAMLLAVAFRIGPALAPVDADNDMIRYLWDGRVQRMGYNPYAVLPADPAMAHTHTADTAQMPSLRARTPYPPAAQLFFRMVVSLRETARAMKVALVLCDILTMIVLWRWLIVANRNEWLVLAYAWNPLVVLEVSHSGHIDALGALWITASAYWLTRQRTALASVAFVLAIATKLLPIVLAPLYWRRIRFRDGIMAAALMLALYLPFSDWSTRSLGAVPNVVAHIRFNGPLFKGLAAAASPHVAAGIAVLAGLAAAVWARWRLDGDNPAGWAWPMALSLACAPVIYPWYLLYFTPFLFSLATLPLIAWTFTVLPVYLVWELAREGGRWAVPAWLVAVEYAVVAGAVVWLSRQKRLGPPSRKQPARFGEAGSRT
jgi:alpha-1,6-mannosyltransferase